ncbi:MAG: hypothetical protein ACRECJ_09130 [Limisphaerales bacterium]
MPEKSTGAGAAIAETLVGGSLSRMRWSHIKEPGVYVNPRTGEAFRFYDGSIVKGGSPGTHQLSDPIVFQVSPDPDELEMNIRRICADNNIKLTY